MLVGAFVLAAAALLVVAGAAKLRTPRPAATMIASVLPWRVPRRSSLAAARAVALVEIGAGSAAVALGARWALAVLAGCYLVLAAAAALVLVRSGERVPCGCFGAADGVIGRGHLVLDAAALGVAVWALVDPPGPVTVLFAHGAAVGLTATVQALLLAALGYLSITALPAMVDARRRWEAKA